MRRCTVFRTNRPSQGLDDMLLAALRCAVAQGLDDVSEALLRALEAHARGTGEPARLDAAYLWASSPAVRRHNGRSRRRRTAPEHAPGRDGVQPPRVPRRKAKT